MYVESPKLIYVQCDRSCSLVDSRLPVITICKQLTICVIIIIDVVIVTQITYDISYCASPHQLPLPLSLQQAVDADLVRLLTYWGGPVKEGPLHIKLFKS